MPSRVLARSLLVLMTLALFATGAGAASPGQESFYLGTDGFPIGSLVGNPSGGELPNFDRGRDVEVGLFLERSARGLAETDDARYQLWHTDAGGRTIAGFPRLVIWAAPARFATGVSVGIEAFLVDCNVSGNDCEGLASGAALLADGTGDWTETVVDFGHLDHEFRDGRHLGVKVVVDDSSEADAMLAYGFPSVRSRLTVYEDEPVAPAPSEATVVTIDGRVNTEQMRRTDTWTPPPAPDPGPATSSPGWMATTLVSSAALVLLGAFLLGRLTRPGRHEARFVTAEFSR